MTDTEFFAAFERPLRPVPEQAEDVTPAEVGGDVETLRLMLDGEVYGTIVVRSEHDPSCPGGGPDCARLCPVPVQDYGDTGELAAAILASDWLAAHDDEVRRETGERIAQAVESTDPNGSHAHRAAYARAARIAREEASRG